MKTNIIDDENYLENIDFSDERIKPIKHPMIAEVQNKLLLDDDIANWLIHQPPDTREHVNAIIRHFMVALS